MSSGVKITNCDGIFLQITKKYEDCLKEKETVVVKFAQAEGKSIVLTNKAKTAEDKMNSAFKEKNQIFNRMKTLQAEKERAHQAAEKKVGQFLT